MECTVRRRLHIVDNTWLFETKTCSANMSHRHHHHHHHHQHQQQQREIEDHCHVRWISFRFYGSPNIRDGPSQAFCPPKPCIVVRVL